MGGYYNPVAPVDFRTPAEIERDQAEQLAMEGGYAANSRLQDALVRARRDESISRRYGAPAPIPNAAPSPGPVAIPGATPTNPAGITRLRLGVGPENFQDVPVSTELHPVPGPEYQPEDERSAELFNDARSAVAQAGHPTEPSPPSAPARALRIPNGHGGYRILLTNQEGPTDFQGKPSGPTYARQGAQNLSGKALYDAVRGRMGGSAAASAVPDESQNADWRTGTYFDTPPERRLFTRGFLPEGSFTADQGEGIPGGGTISAGRGEGAGGSIADNPDTRFRLALEDAAQQAQTYRAAADVASARTAAELAGDPEREAQIAAARKSPELIGYDLINNLYADLTKKRQAFATWQQRASTPGPDFVEPNQRQLRARMVMDQLGLTDAEERIKTLASIVAAQRVPYNQFAGAGVP